MGLDGVELIMEVEDEYGIKLPDEEASKFRTLGDLFDAILRRLDGRQLSPCVYSPLFYELRRAIVDVVGGEPRAIRPRTKWSELIAAGREREIWRAIETRFGSPLPALVHTRRVERFIFAIGGFASVVIILLGVAVVLMFPKPLEIALYGALAFTFFTIVIIGAVLAITFRLARPYASVIPQSCKSLRDTCYVVARLRRIATRQHRPPSSDREAWETLRTIVAEQLGVDGSSLKRETRFVEDLNVG